MLPQFGAESTFKTKTQRNGAVNQNHNRIIES